MANLPLPSLLGSMLGLNEIADKLKGPWTAARIAKTAGTAVAVGGGGAALFYGYCKLSATRASAPSLVRKHVPEEVAMWLETDTALREACDRMLAFAAFNKPAFLVLVEACSQAARYMHALNTGVEAYGPVTPRKLAGFTAAIERALSSFQQRVPAAAREDYMEVDADFDTAIENMCSNVRLQSQCAMEAAATARGATMSRKGAM